VRSIERFALQAVIAVLCLVPIAAGLGGLVDGPRFIASADSGSPELDSQFRYLSGLLLAIGLGYLASVPRIEEHSRRILLLTGIVVTGGVGRLLAALARGHGSTITVAALAMELVMVPAIALWQLRVARQRMSNA
jgi:hypothetical protein